MWNVLIIGSGGREHALFKKLEPQRLFCCSNFLNPVIEAMVDDYLIVSNYNDTAIEEFAQQNMIDLAVIGPEAALITGIADRLIACGIRVFGPTQELAKIETSKIYCREFLRQHTLSGYNPEYAIINNFDLDQLNQVFLEYGENYVIKPDGLHSGKGVKVSGLHLESIQDGLNYIKDVISNGESLLIEQKLSGYEFTIMSITDGTNCIHLPPIKDYKLLNEGDTGPNTGGMGCEFATVDQKFIFEAELINHTVINKLSETVNFPYQGVLYGTFMVLPNGKLKVIEYNARFGDPEGILALSVLECDFMDLLMHATDTTQTLTLKNYDNYSVNFDRDLIVKYLVPWNYPENPLKNHEFYVKEAVNSSSYYFAGVTGSLDNLQLTGARTIAVLGRGLDETNYFADTVIGPLNYRRDIGRKVLTTYQDAGVNIDEGNLTVDKIKTLIPDIGGFGGIIPLGENKLVFSIDGVGTKTHFVLNNHPIPKLAYQNLGHDIVNHCVNDILVEGGSPLAFLDYFASDKISSDNVYHFVRGLRDACNDVDCKLVGGETAEMPITYRSGSCDLVGVIAGELKDKYEINGKRDVQPGDVVLFIPSSGLHTNGYTLVNKIVDQMPVDEKIPPEVLDRLLASHRCYYHEIRILQDQGIKIHGLCHVTGGGLIYNPPRIMSKDLEIRVLHEPELPCEIDWIMSKTKLSLEECKKTFNCGIGMIIIVNHSDSHKVLDLVADAKRYGIIGLNKANLLSMSSVINPFLSQL